MKLREKFQEQVEFPLYLKELQKLEKIADSYAIEVMNWSREVDTPENAEKWFGYSDQDMLNEFKKEKGLC